MILEQSRIKLLDIHNPSRFLKIVCITPQPTYLARKVNLFCRDVNVYVFSEEHEILTYLCVAQILGPNHVIMVVLNDFIVSSLMFVLGIFFFSVHQTSSNTQGKRLIIGKIKGTYQTQAE